MTPLEKRVAAAQATLDHFKGKTFVWGQADCAILAAHLLRGLGVKTPLRSFGTYRTALGAKRALLKRGFNDLADVLDDLPLPRIGHASVLPADIIALEGVGGDPALAVVLGHKRVLAFAETIPGAPLVADIFEPLEIKCAWRAF